MDSLKNRVRAFTEAITIMVSPVLLAIAVNLKAQGNQLIRGSICSVAAVTLEAGILPFLGICLSKTVADLSPTFSRYLFGASKLLIHLCALLLMALACGILLLISMKKLMCLLSAIPFVALTMWRCYWSVRNGETIDAMIGSRGFDGALEKSVDFSAAVTAILFLGLEGLALEGQRNGAQGLEHLLDVSVGVSFVTCVVGVFIMLLGSVPPMIAGNGDTTGMGNVVEALNVALAIAAALAIFIITSAALKEVAWLVFIPPFVSFMVWMYIIIDGDNGRQAGREGDEEVKPASLELTKVTFTGFLAVSVPTFSDGSLSVHAHAFMLLTAAAVITGLGWRLLTHSTTPSRAMATAANVASYCAHLCVAADVIPFAMAVNAFK